MPKASAPRRRKEWVTWLFVWLGAFPAAVLLNFIRFELPNNLSGVMVILAMLCISYVLLGWIPVVITYMMKT